MSAKLPPWFKFEPAVVFSSQPFQAALRDGDMARALLQLMSWNWNSGPLEVAREALAPMLGVPETTVRLLELLGVVRLNTGGTTVLVSLGWLIEARDEAVEYCAEQSNRRAKKNHGGTTVEPRCHQRSTIRREEKRRE